MFVVKDVVNGGSILSVHTNEWQDVYADSMEEDLNVLRIGVYEQGITSDLHHLQYALTIATFFAMLASTVPTNQRRPALVVLSPITLFFKSAGFFSTNVTSPNNIVNTINSTTFRYQSLRKGFVALLKQVVPTSLDAELRELEMNRFHRVSPFS